MRFGLEFGLVKEDDTAELFGPALPEKVNNSYKTI
jgi:hypothetical protein